jgi:hypothetical protein
MARLAGASNSEVRNMKDVVGRLLPLLVFAFPHVPVHAQEAGGMPPAEQCARVNAVPRYEGFGYVHSVEVVNGCKKAVECEVWTDVDPTPRHKLTVEPGQTGSVTTRRGSPAREFKADKVCRYVQGGAAAR